jgi:hypothetical protein
LHNSYYGSCDGNDSSRIWAFVSNVLGNTMIKSLQSYFKFRHWKSGNNKPSQNTAIGKFAYEVWNNALTSKINDVQAIKWLMEKRQEIRDN